MAIFSFLPRFSLQRIQNALAHLLIGFAKNGRFISGVTLALFIAIIFSFMGLQRRESARFAQLLDLHFAMDRWRHEPATHSDQLPHLCELFRLQPHMLKRFGGEFLSSAIFLRGEMGQEGSDINRWFFSQQKRWEIESVPHFAQTTLMANRGEYALVANNQLPLPAIADLIKRASESSFRESGHDILLAYHMMRCAACGYLSGDKVLFEVRKKELLSAADLWSAQGKIAETQGGRSPFSGIFNCYRTGQVSLFDWALNA